MIGALFKLGLLRLCTLIWMVIILPCCTDREHIPYVFATVGICTVTWLLCFDKVASHLYVQRRVYIFTRWCIGFFAFVFLAKMRTIYSVPDENMEMLTFVNLKNIYTCLSSEVYFFQKLVSFILQALCRLFGLLKPFLYIVYLIFNSLILLFLLEIIITRIIWNLQNGILEENNFRTVPVPEGVHHRKALLDNISISDHDKLVYIEPCDTGTYREDYIRYVGEDVQMNCGFFLKYNARNTRLKMFNSYWVKQGQVLISYNADRIEAKTDIEVLKDVIWVKMSLTIKFLRPEEFGLYKCICDYTIIISELHAVPVFTAENTLGYILKLYETEATKICNIGKHFVSRSADLVEHIEIPVGNLAHIIKFFYITQAPVDEIAFEYRVNGKDVHNICRPDYGSCTLSVILYGYLKYGGPIKDILRWHTSQYGDLSFSYVDLQMCVCGSFYGEHSLTMYIPYFNSTTQRQEIVEIVHEKILVIEPVALWWRKNSTRYNKMIMDPASENSKVKEYVTELVCSSQELNFFILNMFSYCIATAVLSILFRLFSYPWKYYCRLTVLPVKNLIFYGYLVNPPKPLKDKPDRLAEIECHKTIQYDVYLSYSAEDYKWSKDVLLPFLEEECGFSVCFPDRDLAHEAGKSKLALYSSATQACAKFVVVLSQGYIDDPDCNRLQLSTCILPLINEEHEKGRKVIFIKRSNGISMPIQLKWNMDVHVVDWTQRNSENDMKIQLKRFLKYRGVY